MSTKTRQMFFMALLAFLFVPAECYSAVCSGREGRSALIDETKDRINQMGSNYESAVTQIFDAEHSKLNYTPTVVMSLATLINYSVPYKAAKYAAYFIAAGAAASYTGWRQSQINSVIQKKDRAEEQLNTVLQSMSISEIVETCLEFDPGKYSVEALKRKIRKDLPW